MKSSRDSNLLEYGRNLKTQTYYLNGMHTDLITCRHSPWALEEGSSLGGTRDILGGTEFCSVGVRARGTEAIVLLLSISPMQSIGGHHLDSVKCSPSQPILDLHCEINSLHPLAPRDPAPPNSLIIGGVFMTK